MGDADQPVIRDLTSAGVRKTVRMWWRLELGAYHGLKTELPMLRGEWSQLRPSVNPGAWVASVDLLIASAEKYLDREPEIAWQCYKAATRMMLHAFEGAEPANKAEVISRATEVLEEANEKLGKWRAAAIKKMLSEDGSDGSKVKPEVELRALLRARRVLDGHHDNLHRKMKVLRKRLRVLEGAGIVAIVAWIALWPQLGVLSRASWELWQPWMAWAVALMGVTGAIISGFSATKGANDSRVPPQEAELVIMIARLVFGTLAALAVVSFMESGVLNLGPPTVPRALAAAFAAGFSERLVVTAVNSFAAKEH